MTDDLDDQQLTFLSGHNDDALRRIVAFLEPPTAAEQRHLPFPGR